VRLFWIDIVAGEGNRCYPRQCCNQQHGWPEGRRLSRPRRRQLCRGCAGNYPGRQGCGEAATAQASGDQARAQEICLDSEVGQAKLALMLSAMAVSLFPAFSWNFFMNRAGGDVFSHPCDRKRSQGWGTKVIAARKERHWACQRSVSAFIRAANPLLKKVPLPHRAHLAL
jgi:hypothetical protein